MYLDSYATGIELAFAVNVLFSIWNVVYRQLEDRQAILTKGADDLASDRNIQEELSIDRLKNTIGTGRFIRKWGLITGRLIGLSCGGFLFYVVWHVPLETTSVDDGNWMLMLHISAWTFPCVMVTVAILTYLLNWWASSQYKKLNEVRERNKKVAESDLAKLLNDALSSMNRRRDDEDH